MIDLTELRIGNWITVGKSNPIQITGIFNEYIRALVLFPVHDDVNPIPLTPEILEKAGFVKNRNGEPSIEINDIASHLELMVGVDNLHYPSFTQTPQGSEERTVYFNRINSLHQLQNLYFALTGEELTINL